MERLFSSFPWLREALPLVCRLVLGAVLIGAGLTKLEPHAAERSVRAYDILPEWGVVAMAHGLPFLEIALGVLLVLGLGTRLLGAVSALLMLVFVAGIASVWYRGINIDCGCFGTGGTVDASQTEYPLEIARDLGLALLGAYLVWRPRSRFSLDGALGLFAPDAPATSDEDDDEGDDDEGDLEDGTTTSAAGGPAAG